MWSLKNAKLALTATERVRIETGLLLRTSGFTASRRCWVFGLSVICSSGWTHCFIGLGLRPQTAEQHLACRHHFAHWLPFTIHFKLKAMFSSISTSKLRLVSFQLWSLQLFFYALIFLLRLKFSKSLPFSTVYFPSYVCARMCL